jgi:hypothetical protein
MLAVFIKNIETKIICFEMQLNLLTSPSNIPLCIYKQKGYGKTQRINTTLRETMHENTH